jgi:hypothetical protein
MNNEEEYYDNLIKEGFDSIKSPKISDQFDQKVLKALRPRPKLKDLWREYAAPAGILAACVALLCLLINSFAMSLNSKNSADVLQADLYKIHGVTSAISPKIEIGGEHLSPLTGLDHETEMLRKTANPTKTSTSSSSSRNN